MSNTSNSIISSNALIAGAFKAADNSSKQGNNSVQGMAAGIMMFHAETLTSGRASFDAMSSRGEAFKLLKSELIKEFVTARVKDSVVDPNYTGNVSWTDHVTRTNRTNATQMQALNKGFDLAIALHGCGVTSSCFDAAKGLFSVPVSALLPKHAEPVGVLVRREKNGDRVYLDGTAYRYDLDGKLTAFTAFPAHVLTVSGYCKVTKMQQAADALPASANTTTTNGGSEAIDIRSDITTWSLEHIAKMIAKLAVAAQDIMTSDKPVPFGEWPDELVNAMTELDVLRDDAKALVIERKAA